MNVTTTAFVIAAIALLECGGLDAYPIEFEGLLPPQTICVGASKSVPFSIRLLGSHEGFRVEAEGDRSSSIIDRPMVELSSPPPGSSTVAGTVTVTCLTPGSERVSISASALFSEGVVDDTDSTVVTCTPCDGGTDAGVDAGMDAGSDGGVTDWPAESFYAPLFADSIGDFVESLGGPAAMGEPAIDQVANAAEVEAQDQEAADHSLNNSTYECGVEVDGMRTVCAPEVLPVPAGELVTIVMDLAGPVPLASSETSYVYSAVLDSDGDPTNDFVPLPAYPNDYYQATDRWYELLYSHTAGTWSVKVTQLDAAGTRTEVASSVRAVIEGSRVMFLIARGELPARVPAYRTTSFRHDGMYTQATRGGDVPLADPTLSLFPLGCDATGVECGASNGALADCGSDHQCVTQASRGVCIPASLDACGGLLPDCGSGETCITEGDAIGSPAYCVTDAMLDCICAAAAGRHVFPGCP